MSLRVADENNVPTRTLSPVRKGERSAFKRGTTGKGPHSYFRHKLSSDLSITMRHQSLVLFQAILPCSLTTLDLENGTSRSKPRTEIQSSGYAHSFERIVMQI